jgi:uncharacterized membrane protein
VRCTSLIGQRSISRFGAGLVAALAVVAMACSNDGDSGNGVAQFNQAPAFNNTVWIIAPAGDGSGDVYVGGDFTSYNGTDVTRVVRLNSDGTVDTAFATGTGFNKTVYSIVPVGDGSGDVYVGGDFITYNGRSANALVRLHADGTVDSNFVTGTGFNNTVRIIAPASDGSGDLYIGGAFTSYNGIPANDLVRLNATTGIVDQTFATGTGFTNTVFTIAPLGNGDLYVGGAFTNYNGAPAPRIVRLHASGTMDQNFVTGTGFSDTVHRILPVGDGSGDVYVGGAFDLYNGASANALVRLNAIGTVNQAFATGTGFNNTVFTIALAGNGDLYVGGAFTLYNGTPANDLMRVHANGTLDPAFATGTGFNNTVFNIAPAGDGSGNVYVGGQFTSYQSVTAGRIARLTSNGSPIN